MIVRTSRLIDGDAQVHKVFIYSCWKDRYIFHHYCQGILFLAWGHSFQKNVYLSHSFFKEPSSTYWILLNAAMSILYINVLWWFLFLLLWCWLYPAVSWYSKFPSLMFFVKSFDLYYCSGVCYSNLTNHFEGRHYLFEALFLAFSSI